MKKQTAIDVIRGTDASHITWTPNLMKSKVKRLFHRLRNVHQRLSVNISNVINDPFRKEKGGDHE